MTPFPSDTVVALGDLIAGKYEVTRVLGAGGMGLVVAARHITLDQAVAIKFLIRAVGKSDDAVARFLREARAAARIESDYVCRVFDVGTLPSGVPFMVMEYLEGHDLSQELDARGPLPPGEAVDHILQATSAIAAAHALGIVHRDLKPANLFLTTRPDGGTRIKVLDFGISKSDSEVDVTDTRGIIGTPAYMSPEQARNAKRADHRTDIFSLGAILFELLSGELPFQGETVGEMLSAVMHENPTHLSKAAPDVAEGLVEIVHRCLSRERNDRFADATALGRALTRFAQGEAPSLPDIPLAPGSTKEMLAVRRVEPTLRSAAAPKRDTLANWTHGQGTELSRSRLVALAAVAALSLSLAIFLGVQRKAAQDVHGTKPPATSESAAAPSPPGPSTSSAAAATAIAPSSSLATASPPPAASAAPTASAVSTASAGPPAQASNLVGGRRPTPPKSVPPPASSGAPSPGSILDSRE